MAKKQPAESTTVKADEQPTATAIAEQPAAEPAKPKGKAPTRPCPRCGKPNHPKRDFCFDEACKEPLPKASKGEKASKSEPATPVDPAKALIVATFFMNEGKNATQAIELVTSHNETPLGQLIADMGGKENLLGILKSLKTK